MAVIPQVDVSTRRLETSPSLHYFRSDAGERARAVAGTMRAGADALERYDRERRRMLEVQARSDEREAEYAVLLADNYVRNGWLGTDAKDEQTGQWRHTPGVADRTWEQMRDEKTTALDEMKRLQGEVREQDFYRNLSASQRKVFERKWLFKADAHSRSAQELHMKQSQSRIKDETQRTVAMRGEEVARYYGSDDLVYSKMAARNALLNWADMQGTALNERSRGMLDDVRCSFDDVARSQGWDEDTRRRKLDEYRKVALAFDVNRVTAFQNAAATGQSLGGYSPDQCADKADQMVNRLNGNAFGFRPDGSKKGSGWLGALRNSKGDVVTEFSMQSDAVKVDGKRIDFPMLVPTLTEDEKNAVLAASAGEKPDEKLLASAQQKAVDHARAKVERGESVWANSGAGDETISDEQANALRANTQTARKKLEAVRDEVRREEYSRCLTDIGEIELTLGLKDSKKVAEAGNKLNYDAYCADLAARHPNLTQEQSVKLRGEYQRICKFYDKYVEDRRKFEETHDSQYGYVREDGVFVPASAFPKQSERAAQDEFAETNAIWQNPQTAMARLEAARMTGRLDEADYRRAYAYGTMRMSDDAARWWDANVGKIKELQVAQYGVEKPDGAARKHRKEHANDVKAAGGLYATKRGVAKSFGYSADFVADALAADEDGGEELVPPETLEKVYDTVRRLAANGVDPADACRAILQPAIKAGVDRDLRERLTDPDYFNKVVEDYRRFGTHFTETANANAAAGRGTNWYADVNQTTGKTLVKRGDLTLKPAGKTADEKKTDAK